MKTNNDQEWSPEQILYEFQRMADMILVTHENKDNRLIAIELLKFTSRRAQNLRRRQRRARK